MATGTESLSVEDSERYNLLTNWQNAEKLARYLNEQVLKTFHWTTLANMGFKVDAMKGYRNAYGCTPTVARDAVENYLRGKAVNDFLDKE